MTQTSRLSVRVAREHDVKLVPQMARFAVVGAINTAVDLAVLNALIATSHRGQSGLLYSLFKAISFLVAVLNSYWMNSRWAFCQKAAGKTSMRVGRFISVSVLGLAVNVGVATWVAGFAGTVRWLTSSWPSIAALAGAGCGLAFNFAGYKYLVFYPKRSESIALRLEPVRERGGPYASSIDKVLESTATHPLITVGRISACDQAVPAPPIETRRTAARARLG
jgi:putative flippase GtrA